MNERKLVPITGGAVSSGFVVQIQTRFELPNRGDSNKVYFVKEENAIYRWDEDDSRYFCVGRDYSEIEGIICGGNN